MKKVSVIVPVYNAETVLRTCMESLLSQTLKDIEIICIEDGSTDSSRDILLKYQKEDKRIQIICNDRNEGGAKSRNKGLLAAEGKYIQFVDSDDYIEFDTLENLYQLSEFNKADMCYLGMYFHIEDNIDKNRLYYSILGDYPGVYNGKKLIEIFTKNKEFFLYLCCVFYNNSFIRDNNLKFNDLAIGEGGDFILRALCNAERVLVCSEKYYHYRVHANSITHRTDAKKELLLGQIVQYINVLKYYSQYENATELELFLRYHYRKMAGGIQNLSALESKEIENRLETNFAKHIFYILQQNSDIYGITFNKQILDKVTEKKVIIYGTGYASKEVIQMLQKYQIEIMGFAVTRRDSRNSCIYGHHIYEIHELTIYKDDVVILISANKIYNQEIQKTLDKYGFQDYVFLNVEI